ncbi:MAG: hypothetical protein IT209_07350 [Armatimonadetes bacterium]|nr:hypothetical protein [Armatimonadota bacterium]
MKAVSVIWRKEFATIRQLERSCYGLLKPLGVVMGVGFLMFLMAPLVLLAVPLMVLSGILMFGVFVWMIHLQKAPRREIRCPYCDNANSVFVGVSEFDCDFCQRPIHFNEQGTPMPADGSLDDAKPTSVWES